MRLRMIIAAMAAGLLSACGVGKSATSTDSIVIAAGQKQSGLTKAEIDTIQHDAARLAMERGEFVFMVSSIIYFGKKIPAVPGPNYLEVTDEKLFFQADCMPGKQPRRAASRVSEMTFNDESDQFKMSMTASSMKCPFLKVYLTLYPGSNKASGMLDSWIGIEGFILPHQVARISKSAPSSMTETFDSW